ncbi:hypothetical protein OrNV_gp092 [Oryctes rhinoceros nudivirus]|uniref:Uncharacterized protein n=1 Tax=Oryctes rhinoceros nudivirus TaxID=92521 RepID=A0A6B9QR41_9VIRU|nr:hypothetical protein OrNV_gp092 [Oryctes rhinoceros nudivirus]ACH96222.1 unknown [Oryctes rhinoceros nudivirus]QHG11324.1 hypothetical protein SI_OrNV_gp092 [Oryctes rhinoceros nudivirus]QKE59555.1 hypothetical protein SI_OrNV_gp092 [Oryctes rhinoceros nudivirus]UBO76502.1 hypothetical protein SI_OrNV_gp092 [Oryctes rhinoceros nudivirus]UBR58400.1 hypothetical protein [Oryctes rhinoceros nudivirus]
MLRSLHSHIRGVYMRTPIDCRIWHPTACRFWHATLTYTRILCKRRRFVGFGILLAYACGILVHVYVQ